MLFFIALGRPCYSPEMALFQGLERLLQKWKSPVKGAESTLPGNRAITESKRDFSELFGHFPQGPQAEALSIQRVMPFARFWTALPAQKCEIS